MDVFEFFLSFVFFEIVNDLVRGIRFFRDCLVFIRDMFVLWGIESELIECDGYYVVYGEIGEGKLKFFFMVYFDVVFVNREEWEIDFFKFIVKGDCVYGRGSVDDKGNVVLIMFVLKEFLKEKFDGKVFFVFMGDEEIGGRMVMYIVERFV